MDTACNLLWIISLEPRPPAWPVKRLSTQTPAVSREQQFCSVWNRVQRCANSRKTCSQATGTSLLLRQWQPPKVALAEAPGSSEGLPDATPGGSYWAPKGPSSSFLSLCGRGGPPLASGSLVREFLAWDLGSLPLPNKGRVLTGGARALPVNLEVSGVTSNDPRLQLLAANLHPSLARTGRKGLKEPKEASFPGQSEGTASYATSAWALLVFHVGEVGLGTGSVWARGPTSVRAIIPLHIRGLFLRFDGNKGPECLLMRGANSARLFLGVASCHVRIPGTKEGQAR